MAEVLSSIDPLRSSRDEFGSSSSATDWRAKYNEAADMLSEARNELDDFVHSSKELEEELLRELERNEKTQKDLKDRVSRVEMDRDEWKNKYIQLQTTHNTAVNSLHRELDTLRKDHQQLKVQFRDLELGNDDLERTERQISSSLADVEAKYGRVLEEKIMLEQELLNKAKVEEEAQRLRDDMRDANSEIQVLRDQLDQYKANQARGTLMTPPTTDSSCSPRHDNSSTLNLPTSNGDDSLLDTIVPPDVLAAGENGPNSAPPLGRPLSIASSSDSGKGTPSAPKLVFPKPSLTSRVTSSFHSRSNSLRTSPNKVNTALPRAPRTSNGPRSAPAVGQKSKGVQMIGEMRAKVSRLEQRLTTRVPRLRSGTFDKGVGNSPNPAAKKPPPESPGWVLVMEESPPPRRVSTSTRTTPPPTAFPRSRQSVSQSSETDSPTAGSKKLVGPRRSFTRSNASTHSSSIPTPSTSRPSSPDFGSIERRSGAFKRTSVPVFAGRVSLGSSTDSNGLNSSQRSSSTVGKGSLAGSMGPPPVPVNAGLKPLSVSQLGRSNTGPQTAHPTTTPRGLNSSLAGPTSMSQSLRSSTRSQASVGNSRIGRPLSMSARRTDTGPAVKGLPVDEYGMVIQQPIGQSGRLRASRSGSMSQFGAPGETF